MKLILSLFLMGLSFISFAQNLNPYNTSQRLQDAITDNPEEYHKVLFLFADRVDALELNKSFNTRNLSLSQRNVELFSALKTKANSIQAPYLQIFKISNQVKNVQSLWISNIIYAEIKSDYLIELSHDAAFDFIDLSVPVVLDSYTSDSSPLPPTPNGAEEGLRMINADSMWAMGYTGYGRSVLISDTGVDGIHPALRDKFRGNCTDIEQAWYDPDSDFPIDSGNHGTHVTGIALGLDRMTNDTIGVAFNAQWLATPSLAGTVSTIVAFQWALDPDDNPMTTADMPDVINNSWSDPVTNSCSEIYSSILNTVETTKIATVFSAGNEGPDVSSISVPKNINTSLVNTFSVGSVKNSLEISYASGRGPSICLGEGSISIKPEVSAPGESIRSCRPNGTYGINGGTSMAAPHVSGAILLLREAFPNTTGTEVKMALYMSATDLGEEGEDNTFGMGIINLPAAYNYLIEQGHSPATPLSKENDIIALNLEVSPISCPELFQFNISFENAGLEPLTELSIEYNIGSFSETYQWTGNLLPDEVSSVFIEDSNVPIGDYQLEVVLANPNGLIDERSLNNKILRQIDIRDASPILAYAEGGLGEYCDQSEVYLRVDYQGLGEIEAEWTVIISCLREKHL